jgi:hypothetical protein
MQLASSLNRGQTLHRIWHEAMSYGPQVLISVERDDAALRIQLFDYFAGYFNQLSRHAEEEELVGVTSAEAVAVPVASVLPILLELTFAKVLPIYFDLDLDNLFAGVCDYIGSVILIDGNALLAEAKVFKDRQL